MLIAYARMGGSTILGRNVLLAEDVGLTNGITLGDRCIVGAGSKVTRSWPADSVILGAPAQRMQDEKRQIVMIKKLSRLYEMVRELRGTLKGKAETD
jgi:UDP-3-O-[3-hydroxymyristoyl] glucosamine N-acyltransferase